MAHSGLLQIDEGRQLAFEKIDPTVTRRCGICKLPGHTHQKFPGIQDSIHIIIS